MNRNLASFGVICFAGFIDFEVDLMLWSFLAFQFIRFFNEFFNSLLMIIFIVIQYIR
jgi:hypothetical protein